jgi:hypothetical protein
MQLHICLPIHDSASALTMGDTAIAFREADTLLHQQQARCPALAVVAAEWASEASTART